MDQNKLISKYKHYTPDQYDDHFQDYLINSWSYSKVAAYARNPKAFEMVYIYNQRSKSSSTTVAGQAYHQALESFFKAKKAGTTMELAELEIIVFEYIDNYPIPLWKCQKTTPTIEDCRIDCTKTVTALLRNFFAELSTYLDEIDEIIEVEAYYDEWLVINGVEIPLPCHMKIDLSFRTIHGKIVVCDHKSVKSFTDEEDMKLSVGKQAIIYAKGFEEATGIDVDEVWFVQNKYSKNKDGSKQLNRHRFVLDKDTRRLYEHLLYEPLRQMIQAVNDPDFVFIINDDDKYVDKAELYLFWYKELVAEVQEFNIKPDKQEIIQKRLKKIRDSSIAGINPKVIKEFQKNAASFIQYDLSNMDLTHEEKIEHILRSFGIIVRVAFKFDGYSSNTYLLEISAGVKVASIHSHKLDIANALDVSAVRLSTDLVMHEGKSYLAVEFSKKRERDLIFEPNDLDGMNIPLGRDNFGNVIVWDLNNNSTPHALVCGSTGSGKSVFVKSTIEYCKMAGVQQIYILDPKFEFLEYANMPRVKVVNEILDIEECVEKLVIEMNSRVKTGKKDKIMVIADEVADAISASRSGAALKITEMVEVGEYANGRPKMAMKVTGEIKPLEENLRILLQKGRSSGFRIMASLQRASTKIMGGDTKVNFPIQVCFRVPKEIDSRIVIDEAGGETLNGFGDGLLKSPQYNTTVRFQAYYTPSTEDVEIIEG